MNYVRLICGCDPPGVIRAAPNTLNGRRITCGMCQQLFVESTIPIGQRTAIEAVYAALPTTMDGAVPYRTIMETTGLSRTVVVDHLEALRAAGRVASYINTAKGTARNVDGHVTVRIRAGTTLWYAVTPGS